MIARLRHVVSALAAGVLAFAALPAAAAPAMWVIRDADSTIYLLGTIHVLRPTTVWRTPVIDKAFAQSADLTIEVADVDNPAAAQPVIASLGIDAAHPLSEKIPPADFARLTKAAEAVGLPAQGLQVMRPWMAAVTLTIVPIVKAGYDPQSGVEMKLIADAKAANKPIAGFETLAQQLHILADLPEALQIELLRSDLDEAEKAAGETDKLVAAWAAGDLKALEQDFVTDLKRKYPLVYEKLDAARNRAFADALKAKLAGSGVSFVAVGAGHFVGPDGLIAELAKRGIKAERVE